MKTFVLLAAFAAVTMTTLRVFLLASANGHLWAEGIAVLAESAAVALYQDRGWFSEIRRCYDIADKHKQ